MNVRAVLALGALCACAVLSTPTVQQTSQFPFSTHNILPDFDTLATFEMGPIVAMDVADDKVINSTLVSRDEGSYSTANPTYARPVGLNEPMKHMNNLTLQITIRNETFILDLYINRVLISMNYTETMITSNGKQDIQVDLYASHCYYIGVVRGHENSTAAVSTCSGIYGAFYVGDKSYFISPDNVDKPCLTCPHRMYETSEQPELLRNLGCGGGVPINSTSRGKRATINEWPQGIDGVTRVVEMYIVNDNSQYNRYRQSQTDVTQRAITVVNIASALYHRYDIYIVIVGQEFWRDYDMIVIGDATGTVYDSNTLLWDFCAYKRNEIRVPHDTAFLITARGPWDAPNFGTVGRAYLGALCGQYGCGVIADYSAPPTVGQLIAHELGHNFGLIHDWDYPTTRTCQCRDPTRTCIMGYIIQATEFSTCSEADLTSQGNHDSFTCVFNLPNTVYSQASPAICGNGIVEAGETCDCGKAPISECNPQCCNNVTCQLREPAQCSSGRCCNVNTCSYKPKYTVCRDNKGSCDLDEYCSGSSNLCPADYFKPNLTQCTVNSAPGFCSNGECRNRNSQCTTMYGTGSRSGKDVCYTTYNKVGNIDGNCGFASPTDLYNYVPCPDQDLYCGTIQCQGGGPAQIFGQIYDTNKTTGGGDQCRSMKFDFIPSRNYGYVMDGSYCAAGKVCQNLKCIPVETAYSYNVIGSCGSCNGNGVCNNLGECHCNAGFAPPSCSGPGEGGSTQSNPIAPAPSTTASSTTASSTTASSTTSTTSLPPTPTYTSTTTKPTTTTTTTPTPSTSTPSTTKTTTTTPTPSSSTTTTTTPSTTTTTTTPSTTTKTTTPSTTTTTTTPTPSTTTTTTTSTPSTTTTTTTPTPSTTTTTTTTPTPSTTTTTTTPTPSTTTKTTTPTPSTTTTTTTPTPSTTTTPTPSATTPSTTTPSTTTKPTTPTTTPSTTTPSTTTKPTTPTTTPSTTPPSTTTPSTTTPSTTTIRTTPTPSTSSPSTAPDGEVNPLPTSSSFQGANGTTAHPCTAALNCGFGGDAIIIIAVIAGALLIFLCLWLACSLDVFSRCIPEKPGFQRTNLQQLPQLSQLSQPQPQQQVLVRLPSQQPAMPNPYYPPVPNMFKPAIYGKSIYETTMPTHQNYWNPPV